MDNPNTYRGYLILGAYPQYDIWELTGDFTTGDLHNEWERAADPAFVMVYSWNAADDCWAEEGDFDGVEFDTYAEAVAAIDKFLDTPEAD